MEINKNAVLHEYMYQQAITMLNDARLLHNQSVITTSKARQIHANLLRELKTKDLSVLPSAFCEAMNSVLAEYSDGQPFFVGFDADNPKQRPALYSDMLNEVIAMTGWSDTSSSSNYFIPLSPYDESNARRIAFLNNGGALLYAKVEDIEKSDTEIILNRQNDNGYMLPVGEYEQPGDLAGLGMLAPYISKRDYNAVKTWVADAGKMHDANGNIYYDESKYMSQQALERSAGILRLMQNEGIGYSVECDDNVGQIRAKITGTKISIRLTDLPENEMYIGKVYDDGVGAYYTTNMKYKTENDVWRNKEYVPSAEETMDLLHFMRGDKLMRSDKNIPVGQPDTYDYNAGVRGKSPQLQNTAYYTSDGYTAAVKPYDNRSNRFVLIKTENNRSNTSINFDAATAEEFLRNSVTSARVAFLATIDVDSIISQFHEHETDVEYEPAYSGDAAIATIQRAYWNVLKNPNAELLKPGATADELNETIENVRELNLSADAEDIFKAGLVYTGSAEERIRQHSWDSTDASIGTYDVAEDGKRFDVANVSKYMRSEFGIFRNNDNLIAAMREANINMDELRGNSFYNQTLKDKMIKFDEKTAKPMGLSSNPFIQNMYTAVKDSLVGSGCTFNEKDILLDTNGIVHYEADRVINMTTEKSSKDHVIGEIGQIFVPDDLGMIQTQFAGSDNYLFIPGYEASVVPAIGDMAGKSLEERTRLKGYEQLMAENIKYHVRSDMMSNRGTAKSLGSTTNLNDTYRRVYDTRHGLDYIKESYANGMTQDILHSIIRTEACRVRYANEFKDNSTVNADFQANDESQDGINDNFMNYYDLSGRRNMSIMTEDGDGYFDPIATATSVNQGITKYLVEGAVVNADGTITPSSKDDRTPIMKHDVCKYMHFNPCDRQVMTFNNLMTASSVVSGVKTAQMTFGGWNFDDGYVISKEFADRNVQRAPDGTIRSMVVGDKISDMNGNKGTISFIADRGLLSSNIEKELVLDNGTALFRGKSYPIVHDDTIDASPKRQIALAIQKELGYENCDAALEWFVANPDLDVVGSPFPAPSRFNGGSARELMENPEDLIAPDGTVYKGSIGSATYIITQMSVDAKSHIYDEDAMAEGRGRKASAQLAWALNAKDCPEIMSEFYSPNNAVMSNLREYLLACGMDMSETGKLHMNYTPHAGESRNVFQIPELEYRDVKTRSGDITKKLDVKSMKAKFSTILSEKSGILEIPFPIKYPTDSETPMMNDTHTDVIYTEQEFERKGYTRKDGVYVSPTTVHKQKAQTVSHEMYGLPIMSSFLRSSSDLVDGSSVVHDYTNQYLRIYESSLQYLDARNQLEIATDSKLVHKLENQMASAQRIAQASYDRITSDISTRIFSGKHNYFRDNVMSSKLPDSATMVWTADPRLKLDEIAMSRASMDAMNLQSDDYIMVWRDPILSDGGVRFLRLVENNNLIGVAVNPAIDLSFEGDFDGDSVGNKKVRRKTAQIEAFKKFAMENNLLNYEAQNEDGTYDIYVQDSLDLKSAKFARPELVEQHNELKTRINQFESEFRAGKMSYEKVSELRKQALVDLSDYTTDAFSHEFGTDMISFKDVKSHMASVEQMVIHKAKGSYGKLADYAKYLGITYQRVPENIDPNQPIALDSITDTHDTLATRKDIMDVQYATAVKAFGTGIAGMYSQRAISALRNDLPTQALGLTHPVTQAILQSKHDPIKAAHQYKMLMKPCRDLWKGRLMEQAVSEDGDLHWKVVRDKSSGQSVQASKSEFIEQFKQMYMDEAMGLGVQVNPDFIHDLADLCVDAKTGKMRNIEDMAKTDAATLDKLAYGGTLSTVMQACLEEKDLFDGKAISCFMPSTIAMNRAIEAGVRNDKNIKAIVKSDARSDLSVSKKPDKNLVVNVPSRQKRDISDVTGADFAKRVPDDTNDYLC